MKGTLEAIEDMEFEGPTADTARMFADIVKDTATLRIRMNDLMEVRPAARAATSSPAHSAGGRTAPSTRCWIASNVLPWRRKS